MQRVVIVGGGAAGSILAIHLIKNSTTPISITIVEKQNEIGRGVAYSPLCKDFLLNVPCSKMGIYPEAVDDFFNWLLHKNYTYSGMDFVPRNIYGEYLEERLHEAIHADHEHEIMLIQDEVVHLDKKGNEIHLQLQNSGEFVADHVVLAIGNFPPKKILPDVKGIYHQPWNNNFWEICKSDDDIALIGTGLTAIDFVNEWHHKGFTGKITMISRNGALPLVHEEPCMQGLLNGYFHENDSLKTILYKVNSIKRHPFLKIVRPVCVIEQLRNLFPRLWYHWSMEERDFFYRRVFKIWNINRHRIPPQVGKILQERMQDGRIEVKAAKIQSVTSDNQRVAIQFIDKSNGEEQTIYPKYVINCIGPDADYSKSDSVLLQQLLADGIAEVDELKTGLISNSKLQLKGQQGTHKNIWAIGPPLKSMFFESTAIHEVRNQAKALSEYILEK